MSTSAAVVLAMMMPLGAARAATVVVAPLHDASPVPDPDTVRGVTELVAGLLADQVTVVASEKLDAVLAEQRLSAAGLSDPATAVRVGKLLAADYVLAGSVFRRADKIAFAVQLLDVATGEVAAGIDAAGPPGELLDVATELAARCAAALEKARPTAAAAPADAAQAARNLVEEQCFLRALGFYYAGDYDQAIMNCLKVIELDPNDPRPRLRMAEAFVALGETAQADITFRRTLELFPELAPSPRIDALMRAVRPPVLQAVEQRPLELALPKGWPADAQVHWELIWQGQPTRRDTARAAGGRVSITMPEARVPLDLTLTLATEGQGTATRCVRLWPADPGIRQPQRPLVIVDPEGELVGLLNGIELKHYKSVASLPGPDKLLVIAPAAIAKLTVDQAADLQAFLDAGGHVSIIGAAPAGVELAGISTVTLRWPAAKQWAAKPSAAAWSYIPSADLVGLLAGQSEARLPSGGQPWLHVADGEASLLTHAARGNGRLLWTAWPGAWHAADPRAARVLALSLSDAVLDAAIETAP